MKKIFLSLLFLMTSTLFAADFEVRHTLYNHTIVIDFTRSTNSNLGCRLKVQSIELQHPDFDKGEYGKIEITTIKSSVCHPGRSDWGHLTLMRGMELPALIWGPYEFIVDGEFVQVLDWSIRGGCETGNGAPRLCF